jgi:hypothetical protein
MTQNRILSGFLYIHILTELLPAASAEPSNFRGYVGSIKRLMSNWGFDLLLLSYGLNVGVFYAISTLLNTVIVRHFQVFDLKPRLHKQQKQTCFFKKNGRKDFPICPSVFAVHLKFNYFLTFFTPICP